jgi:hypothetical protein
MHVVPGVLEIGDFAAGNLILSDAAVGIEGIGDLVCQRSLVVATICGASEGLNLWGMRSMIEISIGRSAS